LRRSKLAGRAGVRIASICTGAFALAAAGLLERRAITTYWASADDREELYPQTSVNRGVLYIDDDPILTSAGVIAGIDLCLSRRNGVQRRFRRRCRPR
jgi:transcriptional regulator GlxA family with amidase domain